DRAARDDTIDLETGRGQRGARALDRGARSHQHLDIERGASIARRETIHHLAGWPGRQPLDLIAHEAGEELACLRRYVEMTGDDLVGGESKDHKAATGRARNTSRGGAGQHLWLALGFATVRAGLVHEQRAVFLADHQRAL